jgi:hypothetical protein
MEHDQSQQHPLHEAEAARLKEAELLDRGEELLNRAREIARSVQAQVDRITNLPPENEHDQDKHCP